MKNKYRMFTKIVRNMKLKRGVSLDDLNENEEEALRYITKHEGCFAKDLVDYLNVDKGLITRIVKHLQSENYVILKDCIDKRKKHLYSTDKANNLKSNIEDYETNYYKSLFINISEKEAKDFFATLEKVYYESKRLRKEKDNEKIISKN